MTLTAEVRRLYVHAIFTGDRSALRDAERTLDHAHADLLIARGMVKHGHQLLREEGGASEESGGESELEDFEHAMTVYVEQGNLGGQAEACFWIGCFHQVVRRDDAVAVPLLQRSLELAREVGDKETASDALRHLGIAAHRAGRLGEAREQLLASTALREESGDKQGVAANLVGLIYIAAAEGRTSDAWADANRARELATRAGAAETLRHIEEACQQLPRDE
jgi:hypothetical protein